MTDNYVFTGTGDAFGKYTITNKDIEEAIDKGFLGGFSKEKILASKRYKEFCNLKGEVSAFEYFAGHIMGFFERCHVAPFPPTKKKLHYAETSLDLAVRAIDNALKDAQIKAQQIDAWFVSTVSAHEQAPGIATTVKSYFCEYENKTPCFSLASGCSGFNINIQRAVEFFISNPHANHVVVAHTETMSSFLRQRVKFVPFVTFGDASAAVVISKIKDNKKYGIINIVNLQDLNMLDFVGVDENKNLYMDDSLIKDRAIQNIPHASEICLKKSGLKIDEIDLLVPHQTGNVILFEAAEKLGIPKEKVYLEGQKKFGNVSGTTVPICFSMLNKSGQLKDGMKILSATAGVGGTYGAFTYIVKNKNNKKSDFYKYHNDLKDKTVLVLGASGSVGIEIVKELEKRNANLILHSNTNSDKLKSFENAEIVKCNFNDSNDVVLFINSFLQKNNKIDYLINAVSSTDNEQAYKVIFLSSFQIIKSLFPLIKSAILQLGTITEELPFYNYNEWTSSHRSIHGFLASASGEFYKSGIRTLYFITGFTQKGISSVFDDKEKFKFMLSAGQSEFINNNELANNIVKSLYLPKILNSTSTYENAMIVHRLGYRQEVDV